ncbi:DUF3862 domain-containing protein [Bacillus sp. JJ1127]|uniref:DUF3862 domain-containing protein n=1 Tax=Bacillus sp. JJ1127 TaxID=3122952 RepID=UPI0030001CDD
MKKPFYKKWWFWVIVVIIVAAASGSGSKDNKEATKTNAEPKQESKQEQPQKEKQKKITLADYESIKVGDSMSGEGGDKYEDLVAKFGEPSNKSESQAGDMKMIMASWTKNINGDFGANFNVTFMEKDGQKLASSKGQMGMK